MPLYFNIKLLFFVENNIFRTKQRTGKLLNKQNFDKKEGVIDTKKKKIDNHHKF